MSARSSRSDPFEAPVAWEDDPRVRRVLDVVDAIPRGKVMSYGDIAALLGLGPRWVAKVMARGTDDALPWWRVLRANGSCAPEVESRQLRHLRAEKTVARGATRVDMKRHRVVSEE